MTRLARRFRRSPITKESDQTHYFEWQHADTGQRHVDHMEGLRIQGKTVLDIGCGLGGRALGWLELGASRVVNIDINRQELNVGRAILDTKYPSWSDRVEFLHPESIGNTQIGDLAILLDCFEHLTDPASVLRQVHSWLRPGSLAWIGSMGWYNYMASHCLSHIPVPWCQVLFSESAILNTIRKLLRTPDYVPNIWERMEGLGRWENVTSLRDRPGEPLNMFSLRRIRRILRDSPFELRRFRVYGFGGRSNRLALLASPLAQVPVLQELLHSYYSALLGKTDDDSTENAS